ncbi:hypothetical protein PMAYCL1PPCAC_17892 [Pristionchus mayeri]|uniref:Uncharacterized protein n=1 Tax=Pristionchus mayeri TaxID=1317129 RepID=A0AAN5I0R9_9BILA|nr:hypothetical protein PMAYCL1PPCAC_17892 [Pristionchus mayeri]
MSTRGRWEEPARETLFTRTSLRDESSSFHVHSRESSSPSLLVLDFSSSFHDLHRVLPLQYDVPLNEIRSFSSFRDDLHHGALRSSSQRVDDYFPRLLLPRNHYCGSPPSLPPLLLRPCSLLHGHPNESRVPRAPQESLHLLPLLLHSDGRDLRDFPCVLLHFSSHVHDDPRDVLRGVSMQRG